MDRMEVKFAADDVAATGEFSGYGAFFNNVDSYGDVIAPGAFKANLREWRADKRLPPMLLQHGGWMMTDTDALPVGKWTKIEEDEKGLLVEGRIINLDTDLGKRVYGAMKEGVLDGMSIGYRAKKFTLGTKPAEPRRKLEAVELIEVSLVTFPANGKARVASVKSNLQRLGSEDWREIEAILRTKDLSQRDAVKAIAGLKDWLQRDAGATDDPPRDEDGTAIADALRRNLDRLSTR